MTNIMTENEFTLWSLLGQSAGPDHWKKANVPDDEYQVDFVWPAGQVSVAFKPYLTTVLGKKSRDPLVPDDPDLLVCDGLEILSIYDYDPNGGESVIPLSYEIEHAFQKWIEDTDYLGIDVYAIE